MAVGMFPVVDVDLWNIELKSSSVSTVASSNSNTVHQPL